jgi:hypothetical protein
MTEDCLLTGPSSPRTRPTRSRRSRASSSASITAGSTGSVPLGDADQPLRPGRQLPPQEFPRAAGAHPALPRGAKRARPRSSPGARAPRGGSSCTWTTWPTPARSSSGQDNPPDWINVGTGTDVTIRELTEIVARRRGSGAGSPGTPRCPTARPQAPRRLEAGRPSAGRRRSGCATAIGRAYQSFLAENRSGVLRL